MTGRRARRIVPLIAGTSAVALAFVLLPRPTYIAFGQVQSDVMQQKLQQAIQTLTNQGLGEEVYQQAISEGMEAIYTSNLVVLPTHGQEQETGDLFDGHLQMANDLIQALTQHIQNAGTPGTKAGAAEARNFIQVTSEAMEAIGQQTEGCDPGNVAGPGCQQIQQTDEGGTYDTVEGFQRQVRSPFFLRVPEREPHEDVFVPGALARGECVPIVKETRGIQAVVRPMVVPIWVEPWFSRAQIVGTATIWVWEFVPAEFVKTISYCNVGGQVRQTVSTDIIRERLQMSLWRFYRGA